MDAERVFALAEQVYAGSEVDWTEAAESSGDENERTLVRNMEVLARIAELHAGTDATTIADGEPTAGSVTPQVDEEDLPPMRRWGHLERLEFIGKGSFGIVCKAWDPTLEIWVALKLARSAARDPAREEEMREEARLMARVKHHNVIRIYGAAEHDGRFGIWMEFIEGRTLAELVKFEGRMDESRVRGIGRALALAVAAVHDANIVHKDIKAQNVMVESGGRIVLMDFGASMRFDDFDGELSLSSLRGTPFYMAPEIFEEHNPSNQSDIYSIGVLLFFLLTGRYPVEAQSLSELTDAHRSRRVRSIADLRPEIGQRVSSAIDRALQPAPVDRYESAGRMAADLSAQRPGAILWVLVGLLVIAGAAATAVDLARKAGSFAVSASLYRHDGVREQLLSGSRVSVGDRLYLEFEGSKPLYVYVFNQDDQGAANLLFPIPGLTPQNPVPADDVYELPGRLDSRLVTWVVTSRGIRERFWMVASPNPVGDLEELVQTLPKANFEKQIQYPTVHDSTLAKLRGIGGLAAASEPDTPATASPQSEFFERIAELTAKQERQRGTWFRRIELQNP